MALISTSKIMTESENAETKNVAPNEPTAGKATYANNSEDEAPNQNTAGLPIHDEKKMKRIMANRRSARESRERRMRHLANLETTVDALSKENATLSRENERLHHQIIVLLQENANLRASYGMSPLLTQQQQTARPMGGTPQGMLEGGAGAPGAPPVPPPQHHGAHPMNSAAPTSMITHGGPSAAGMMAPGGSAGMMAPGGPAGMMHHQGPSSGGMYHPPQQSMPGMDGGFQKPYGPGAGVQGRRMLSGDPMVPPSSFPTYGSKEDELRELDYRRHQLRLRIQEEDEARERAHKGMLSGRGDIPPGVGARV